MNRFVYVPGRPASRWASVALGAGIGIGSAYTECSYLLNNTSPKWADVKASSPVSLIC